MNWFAVTISFALSMGALLLFLGLFLDYLHEKKDKKSSQGSLS